MSLSQILIARIFKTQELPLNSVKLTSKKNKEFFYEICKRLKTLEAYTQVVPDTPQFSEKVKGIATMRESDEEPKIVMRSKTKTRKLLKSFCTLGLLSQMLTKKSQAKVFKISIVQRPFISGI